MIWNLDEMPEEELLETQVIIAKAKVCPHCGEGVSEAGQALHAVYDKIELPPVKPSVTRVEPYSGRCAGWWAAVCGPGAGWDEPGHPIWGFCPESGDVPALHARDQ